MVYQMASTPPCFLVYPRYTPSPLFDKLSTAILHCKDGVSSNETGHHTSHTSSCMVTTHHTHPLVWSPHITHILFYGRHTSRTSSCMVATHHAHRVVDVVITHRTHPLDPLFTHPLDPLLLLLLLLLLLTPTSSTYTSTSTTATTTIEQWPTVIYWPLHLLSDNGWYIAKIIWNILLTGLPLGIAFIPTSKWWLFLPIAIIIVICMAALKALTFIIALGKFMGVRDEDFDVLFCRVNTQVGKG